MHSGGGQWLLSLLMLLGSVYAATFGMTSSRFRCKFLHVNHMALDKRWSRVNLMDCASMHNLIRREVRILLFPVRKEPPPHRQHIQYPRQRARAHDMNHQHDGPDCQRMDIAPGEEHTPRGSVECDEMHAE